MNPQIPHRVAGGLAMFLVLSFWTSTIVSEVLLSHGAVAATKQAILYGLLLLVPSIALAGISGLFLARRRPGLAVGPKAKRMRLIAANGVLIMLPAAFYLFHKAAAAEFDATFYVVQALELLAGAIQLSLMARNYRDGVLLARRGRSLGGAGESLS